MASSPNIEDKFIDNVKIWWNRLLHRIETSRSAGREIYLVAISRKMPRIFEWIRNIWIPSITDPELKEKREQQLKTIEEIGLVCEHALPFILSSDSPENEDIIVIDDIIIRGHSMEEVTEDIYAYTNKRPYISTIYISELCSYSFSNAIFEHKDDLTPVKESEIKKVVDCLCNCIKGSSLPMELEFPVFHLASEYNTLKRALENGNKTDNYRSYDITHHAKDYISDREVTAGNFSIILEHELKWTLNHDYPKIRLFEKPDHSACLEVSSPRVIPVSDTESHELFKESHYHELWGIILDAINHPAHQNADKTQSSHRVKERHAMTLAVWANYLFSFSVGMNACKKTSLLKKFPAEPFVEEKDITLLLGSRHAKTIVEKLNEIGKGRVTEPWLVEQYFDTDMYISEPDVQEKYEEARYYSSLNFKNIESALEHLFRVHQNPEMLHMPATYEVDTRLPHLGKTISSLEDILDYSFNDDEQKFVTDLNRALDMGVDEGRISPFYCKVESSTGALCWRRFYRGGSRSIL